MPDRSRTLAASVTVALCLSLAGCDNSATTYACDGTGACRQGLDSQPAEGESVKLYLSGVPTPLYGAVTAIDEQAITLETRAGGRLVVLWNQVAAWESGDAVREELTQAQLIELLMDEHAKTRAKTNEMISITAGKLPGAEGE